MTSSANDLSQPYSYGGSFIWVICICVVLSESLSEAVFGPSIYIYIISVHHPSTFLSDCQMAICHMNWCCMENDGFVRVWEE